MTTATDPVLERGLVLIRRGAPFDPREIRAIHEAAAALGGKAKNADERRIEDISYRLTSLCAPIEKPAPIVTPFDDEVARAKAARDAAWTEEERARDELFDARDERRRLMNYEVMYDRKTNTDRRVYITPGSTPATREAALCRIEAAEDRHRKAEADLASANATFGRANQRRENHIIGYGLR